jgi:hypothetical protein
MRYGDFPIFCIIAFFLFYGSNLKVHMIIFDYNQVDIDGNCLGQFVIKI